MAPVDQVLSEADEDVNTTEFPAQMLVEPLADMVGVGTVEPIETTVGSEVSEGQTPTVVVTVYDPAVLTVIDGVVAPFDHTLLAGSDEVRITLPPVQKVVGPLAEMVGNAPCTTTVMVLEGVEVQPDEVYVTEYVPEVETVMDCVVAPFDQVLPVADEDVNVTVPPAQNVVGPSAVITGAAGPGETETVNAFDVLLHQLLNPVVVVVV